jgi:hypothetical protein
MTSLDFLYISLGIAVWVAMGSLVYVTIALVKLFDHLKTVTKVARDTALDVQIAKGSLKLGIYSILKRIVNNLS